MSGLDGLPSTPQEVEASMAEHGVPGASIAVIDDFEVVWSAGLGVTRAGTNNRVTDATLFQTASIGKSVTAVAALAQVRTGLIGLDHPVDDYLLTWDLARARDTGDNAVTVRGLLSHTAGVNVPSFLGYPRGTAVPTLLETLQGAPPANNLPIRVVHPPGSAYSYSGGGYQIVQQVLTDASGAEFAALVGATIFEPLGMASSVYGPLREELWGLAAVGHRAAGHPVAGAWHEYPEHAAGPFWTTAADFARFAIEVMKAHQGLSDAVITQELATEMFTPVAADYALGLAVIDDGGDRLHAVHDGGNEGYKTHLVLYPQRGQGAVILTNSDNGLAFADDLVAALSLHYRWVSGFILTPAQTTWALAGIVLVGALLAGLVLQRRRGRRRGLRGRSDPDQQPSPEPLRPPLSGR